MVGGLVAEAEEVLMRAQDLEETPEVAGAMVTTPFQAQNH
tara:strand:+ start:767 stop:886 length:120 start_codon:yes stop_codon:yes gene_type:complete